MNIVIAGAGKVGYFLAKALMEENDVTIIDRREVTTQNIEGTLDVLSIHGDVENPHTYRSITKDIDLFIAVTDSDEVNLLSCLIIDNIATVKEKIVRLRSNLFMNENIKNKLAISTMISPAHDVAQNFNYLADFPHVNNVKTFDYTKAFLLSIRAYEEFESTVIFNFLKRYENKLIVAGIQREDKFFIPDENDLFMANDLLYFFAFPSVVNELRAYICNKADKQVIKNCIIYGANQLGIEISSVLSKKGLNIKLIDKNMQNCQNANAILKNHAEVIKSNYDLDYIMENSSADVNVFIAATGDDEFNIIKCIEAKQKGIEKVIGIYNSAQYGTLMKNLGIEVLRGEKMSAYNSILENINPSNVIKQKAYCGDEGKVYLKQIVMSSPLVGQYPVIPNKISKGSHIYVQREKRFIPYKDMQQFQVDDILIVFTQKEDAKAVLKWLKQ